MNEAEQKMMDLYKAQQTTGFEHLNAQDFQPPFLIIIQKMSPQVDPSQELYDPLAKIGLIHNTQSLKYYEKVHVIMARYEFRNVEWKPRTTGGGFVGSHDRTKDLGEIKVNPLDGRSYNKEGNVVMPTAYYLIMLEEEEWAKIIMPLASTQLKKARQFNSKASAIKLGDVSVPLYGRKYTLSTIVETNSKGSWYGWKFDAGENLVDPVLFAKAAETAAKMQSFLPEKLVQSLPPPEASDGVI